MVIRGRTRNALGRATAAWVRIPPSPLQEKNVGGNDCNIAVVFLFWKECTNFAQQSISTEEENEMITETNENSYFDGGLFQYIGYRILGFLVTVLTFGICLPWAYTMIYKWRIKHTVINGKRLYFDGTALQLFGNWIKWWFLTVITFGIYGFWVFIKLEQWKTKHTHFRDSCKGSNVPFIKKNRSGI